MTTPGSQPAQQSHRFLVSDELAAELEAALGIPMVEVTRVEIIFQAGAAVEVHVWRLGPEELKEFPWKQLGEAKIIEHQGDKEGQGNAETPIDQET